MAHELRPQPQSMRPITSTYRLQLTPDFTFEHAAHCVPYLTSLGVSHLYLSPLFTATLGSQHGYDVTDPTTVREELGGRAGLEALADIAHQYGLGLIVDIVPNHMGVAIPAQNPWWWDVLQHGKHSPYAHYFDIDWDDENRFNIPILGSAHELSELQVDGDELHYFDHRYPLAPGTLQGSPQEIHDRQHYRLVYWNTERVGYRRFFSVNELAGLRQEDPQVFEATHAELLSLVRGGFIDGVRVDHPDGLTDPVAYLQSLRTLVGPDCWLIVEKILHSDESLDPALPVDGTTGYDALREISGVFVSPDGETFLSDLSEKVTDERGDASSLAHAGLQAKREAAFGTLRSELGRLVRCIKTTFNPEVSAEELAETIVSTICQLTVYRTDYPSLTHHLAEALSLTKASFPQLSDGVVVLSRALETHPESAARFHQLCGPIMAKGMEDRLFYRTARLLALQEVGGTPGEFGMSLQEFHLRMAQRSEVAPRTMTTLTTHDTKRGEDVRARLMILAESTLWSRLVFFDEGLLDIPPGCAEKPSYLFPSGHDFSNSADGVTGYFLWQTLWGMLPAPPSLPPRMQELERALENDQENSELRAEYLQASEDWNRHLAELPDDVLPRIRAYAEKATREAALRTSWNNPDVQFEKQIDDWILAMAHSGFAALIRLFRSELEESERANILGQKLIQLTCPGIPDIYQGTEFVDDSLVDPDNRRPVDFTSRILALSSQDENPSRSLSREKQQLVRAALQLRRERPRSFLGGGYWPIPSASEFLLGFGRGSPSSDQPDVLVLVTRFASTLQQKGGWGGQGLDLGQTQWHNRLDGKLWTGLVTYAELFADRPVALLAQITR